MPLNATISCVLSRSRVLSCANNISKAFKVLFQIGTAAEEMRRDTSDNVKDLCPAFVNLTSTVVWMGNIRDLTFMLYLCSEGILTIKAVEDTDFAHLIKSINYI